MLPVTDSLHFLSYISFADLAAHVIREPSVNVSRSK